MLPPAIRQDDANGYLSAFVDGFQDRSEDLRALARTLQNLNDVNAPSLTANNVCSLTYVDKAGTTITVPLNTDSTTPDGSDPNALADWAADQAGLKYWVNLTVTYGGQSYSELSAALMVVLKTSAVASQVGTLISAGTFQLFTDVDYPSALQVAEYLNAYGIATTITPSSPQTVQGASLTFDPNRAPLIDTQPYLASNYGATIYKKIDGTQDPNTAIRAHFPLVRSKGTAQSFETIGRMLGFNDVKFIPLWGRLSPRDPGNVSSSDNDADFSAVPDVYPVVSLPDPTGAYDPTNLTDGPYFTYASGTLVMNPTDTRYWPTALNGANPFVNVVLTSVVSSGPPDGTYVLGGGSPQLQASVAIGSGITLQALAPGSSFNGVAATVQPYYDGQQLVVTGQLSQIKFRSEYYDFTAALSATVAEAQYGPDTVTPNSYLQNSGTGVAPYFPLTGGTTPYNFLDPYTFQTLNHNPYTYEVRPAVAPAPATTQTQQIDMASLNQDAMRVLVAVNDVRPAAYYQRKTNVGLSMEDSTIYAAYQAETRIVEGNGTITNFSGSITWDTNYLYAGPLPGATTQYERFAPIITEDGFNISVKP